MGKDYDQRCILKDTYMFEKPSALDNLQNKAEQYKACVQSLNEAATPTERAKWTQFELKQYHQLLEARYEYEREVQARKA